MPAEYEKAKRECQASGRHAHSDWGKWSQSRKDAYTFTCLRNRGWVKGKGGHMVKKG